MSSGSSIQSTPLAITVTPFRPLDKTTRAAVSAEVERLLGTLHPAAGDNQVTIDGRCAEAGHEV
jgi:hypothetical protein